MSKQLVIDDTKIPTLLDKEEARKQFEHYTKELNLTHTFTFDEMWETSLVLRKRKLYRKGIMKVQETIVNTPGALVTQKDIDKANSLKHSFVKGCYIREIFNPKGELIVTKIHKVAHPYFLMKGEMSILTEDGPKRIKAPYHGITLAGTKRIIYTHEECVFITVHVTNKIDLREIEEELIAKDFGEIDDFEQLELDEFINSITEEEFRKEVTKL